MRGLAIFSMILLAVGVFFGFSFFLNNDKTMEVFVMQDDVSAENATTSEKILPSETKEEIKEDAPGTVIKEKRVPLLPTIAPTPKPSVSPTPPPPIAIPKVKSGDIYEHALQAVLNVFCYDHRTGSYILGSAAVVHPDGYVLTNGHLAEHFLDPETECILRRGSPASNFAKAKVVWLPDQSKKIGKTEIPEQDIAVLKITELINGSNLPPAFNYFRLNPDYSIAPNQTFYSLNYPTEFLGAETAVKNANLVFSLGKVESLVSVNDDTSNAEGAYLTGEVSVQHGSSGGIFLDMEKGEIVGLFVGLTDAKTTSGRKQFIFLASYLDLISRNEKGMGFLDFLNSKP
ncbi:trypsin-like peptidase domain-containing protein [Candidatus Giovannonibacteria bacterium]|nr:trypsin-like peptidase domain-containing protein [Candidatus Giovannonibacteria bacterium]